MTENVFSRKQTSPAGLIVLVVVLNIYIFKELFLYFASVDFTQNVIIWIVSGKASLRLISTNMHRYRDGIYFKLF